MVPRCGQVTWSGFPVPVGLPMGSWMTVGCCHHFLSERIRKQCSILKYIILHIMISYLHILNLLYPYKYFVFWY